MKKITITGKPEAQRAADQWVAHRIASVEATKRLTLDISETLHRRVKLCCTADGVRMSDVIRELLESRFPPEHHDMPGGITAGANDDGRSHSTSTESQSESE